MRDKIIEQVINKIKSRSDVGYKKYKVTLADDDQPLDTWLQHLQEELKHQKQSIQTQIGCDFIQQRRWSL